MMQKIKHWHKRLMGDSLYRNSLYLLVNMGLNTAGGFLFVLICTHLYPQEEVGYAIAMLSALALAGSFANIGMNRTIARFLGPSKTKSQDLSTKILLAGASAIVVGIIMSFFFSSLGFKDASLATSLLFIFAVILTTIKALFDNAFIATRSAAGTLLGNSLANVCKLVLPVFLVSWGFMGMFGALIAGTAAAVIGSIVLLRVQHKISLLTRPKRASMTGKWRFAFGSYSAELIGNLPITIVPLIVIAQLGPKQSALWYAAMQFTTFLLMVSSSINQALFAEMANSENGIIQFVKKASLAMYALIIPLALLTFICAPQLLRLLGPAYIDATHVLRMMSVFALLGVANYIAGSVIAYYQQVLYLTVVNICNALIVILYCVYVATNLQGVAVGWMLGEAANIILFVGGAIIMYRKQKKA